MKPWQRVWDRCIAYAPLAAMAWLALGTYWLLQNTPAMAPASAPQAPQHEPDYFLHQFTVRSFDQHGQLRTDVTGVQARHYPDQQALHIDELRIRSFDVRGRLTTASAQRGIANDAGTEVQLIGQAHVIREAQQADDGSLTPRMEYRSAFLHAFLDTERVQSNQPVEISRGSTRFTADNLDFDNPHETLQLRGRVRGILVPERRAQP